MYKCPGFCQLTGIRHSDIKIDLQDEFFGRVNCVLKTFLNAGNKVREVTTLAIPLLIFSLGVITWSKINLENLERRIRRHSERSGCTTLNRHWRE